LEAPTISLIYFRNNKGPSKNRSLQNTAHYVLEEFNTC